jgi:hypothetical protein
MAVRGVLVSITATVAAVVVVVILSPKQGLEPLTLLGQRLELSVVVPLVLSPLTDLTTMLVAVPGQMAVRVEYHRTMHLAKLPNPENLGL